MLAAPWAHELANAQGRPAHKPQPARHQRQDEVQRVIDGGLDENLLMPAPWAVCAYFFLFHLAWGTMGGKFAVSLPPRFPSISQEKSKVQGERLQNTTFPWVARDGRRAVLSRLFIAPL
jgi:hypothetical protein